MVTLLRETRGLGVMKGCRLPDGSRWGNCRRDIERTPAEQAEADRIGELVRTATWFGSGEYPRAMRSDDWCPRTRSWRPGWRKEIKRR